MLKVTVDERDLMRESGWTTLQKWDEYLRTITIILLVIRKTNPFPLNKHLELPHYYLSTNEEALVRLKGKSPFSFYMPKTISGR